MNTFENIEIIGVSGKLGSGKNYITENILFNLLTPKKTVMLAFADHLKIEVIAKDNIEYERVFIKKDTESRTKLQKRGTEEGRNVYGENIWINTIQQWMRVFTERGIERVIIIDVRFKNEADFIKSIGGTLIHVNAPDRTQQKYIEETNNNHSEIELIKNHTSETDLDNYKKFDFEIDNTIPNQNNVINDIENIVIQINNKNKFKTTIFFDLDDTLIDCHIYYDKFIYTNFYSVLLPYLKSFDVDDTNLYKQYQDLIYSLKYNSDYFRTPYTLDKFSNLLVKASTLILNNLNIPKNDILDKVFKHGMNIHNIIYSKKDGAFEFIENLPKDIKVVICTVGDRLSQMKKIIYHGLHKYDIEISTFKNKDLYINLMQKYKSDRYIIIGDSSEREILPALDADFHKTIHILNHTTKPLDISSNRYIAVNNVKDITMDMLK